MNINREPSAGVRSFASAPPSPTGERPQRAAVPNDFRGAMPIYTGGNTPQPVVNVAPTSEVVSTDPVILETYNFKRDLLERMTSRVFMGFVGLMVLIIVGVANGGITWNDAIDNFKWGLGIFGGVEGARDVASILRGKK